ncbi:Methyltransferase domain-containing protein [Thermoactinomyces sp. DSM 45891]|uniref:class I SAM-dependent methyltransferase n=1 Tax=Thermoactinomyces sp. DSM 45891 TaxID=1761907 RepID=UPI0009172D07|nr:class I SAM-dependent methyltransferase [Thermoactinomyces sp. DSM 45891]SFX77173.1 Methyltransferase domain-containing protein [Thermoactinomyces sp. DSM 45891]
MSTWYQESFGKDYLLVYHHRDQQNAEQEVKQITEWLQLTTDDFILDLCCGTGRHTATLAMEHLNVVGLDLSPTLLSKAVSRNQPYKIPFIIGDMRHLPFVGETYDVVLNLFTSFGYFETDEENEQVIREVARVLKPKGRFLIDYLNREYVVEHLVAVSQREQDGIHIQEERSIQGDFVVKKITLSDKQGERTYTEQVKMYTYDQMIDMLHRNGLRVKQMYGGFNGTSYHENSPRMILIGNVE